MNAEPKLSANALRTLRARYLRRDESGKILETPRELYARVANFIAGAEHAFDALRADPLRAIFVTAHDITPAWHVRMQVVLVMILSCG